MVIKILKWFSKIWFVICGLLYIIGVISIWYFEGFGRVQEVLSPFNIANTFVAIAILSPGIGVSMLAEYLEKKKK